MFLLYSTSLAISFLTVRASRSFFACLSCRLAYLRNVTFFFVSAYIFPIKFEQIYFLAYEVNT